MKNFYQVVRYLHEHNLDCEYIRVKLRNGMKINNHVYDRDAGKSDVYFKTFGQLFYIMPELTKSRFVVMHDYAGVLVHEL